MKFKDFLKKAKQHVPSYPSAEKLNHVAEPDIIDVNGKKFVKVKLQIIDHSADDYIHILEQMVDQLQRQLKQSSSKSKFEKQFSDLQIFNIYLKRELSHLADHHIQQKSQLQNCLIKNEELLKQLQHLSHLLYEKEELLKQSMAKNSQVSIENLELKLSLYRRANAAKINKKNF